MTVTISAWGNSLGLRIPKAVAAEFHLAVGDRVEVLTRDGELIVVKSRRPTLEELLVGVTPDNHEEEAFATFVGNEVW